MSKTLTGVFDSDEHAAHAVEDLLRRGVPREEIAVIPAIAASLDSLSEKRHATRAQAAALVGGVGMLVGALIGTLALRLDGAGAFIAALVGGLLGAAAGVFGVGMPTAEHATRGNVLVAVRTADSKLARIAKKIFAREALDYAWRGTTVAR
jgi:hypothetical protein